MAKQKVYSVIIDGQEFVSKAAQEAGEGMDKFTKKKDGWFKSFVDLKAMWDLVAQAARALYGVTTESLLAFDEYDASMRRLEGTAKITGTPLAELSALAADAKREFGLSSVQANEYATSVNNLATKAGFAGEKQALLAAMLDVGAAKGLTAAESLQAFQQSILGIDEGTDKLFGKNPSGLWADFAEQVGKSPGKMSDLDKSMVLIYATMEAGGKVQGSYSEWVQSSAGQTALLSNRLGDAKVAFGGILSPIRAVVVEGINTFADSIDIGTDSLDHMKAMLTGVAQNLVSTFLTAWRTFGPTVITVLKATVAGVMLFSDALQMLQIVTQEVVGFIAQKLGGFAEKTASLMRKLGFDVTAEWGTSLRKWGEDTDRKASETYLKFRQDSHAAWNGITRDAQAGSAAAIAPIAAVGAAATRHLGTDVTAASARGKAAIVDSFGPSVQDLLGVTEQAMKDLGKTASMTLAPKQADDFASAMSVLRGKVDTAREALEGFDPALETADTTAGDLSGRVSGIARAALDLGSAFGVLDADTTNMLNSVVNIGTSMGRMLAGDMTSIAGVVGGVASIVSQITGGDKERRRLLADNTRNLDRLTREVGNLRLNATGNTFGGIQSVLQEVIPKIFSSVASAQRGDVTLEAALKSRGLTMADLQALAKELGVEIMTKEGTINLTQLRPLLAAMGMTEFGQFGTGFSDRLDSTTRGFDVTGASGIDQIRQLFGVGADFSPALQGVFDGNDLGGTRGRLAGLFGQLQAGTLDAAQFGGLTGTQFLDLITNLIGRIDGLAGSAPQAPSSVPEGQTFVPGVGVAPAATVSVLGDVFKDYAAKSVPLFETQIALQLRIADATEGTAQNTLDTVTAVHRVADLLASGAITAMVASEIGRQSAFRSLLTQGVPEATP